MFPSHQFFLQDPETKVFLEMCLWEKGIRDIDESVRGKMLEELAEDFHDFLLQAVFEKLDEKYLEDWKNLSEEELSTEKILGFFRAKIPDFDKLIEKIMGDFLRIYTEKS